MVSTINEGMIHCYGCLTHSQVCCAASGCLAVNLGINHPAPIPEPQLILDPGLLVQGISDAAKLYSLVRPTGNEPKIQASFPDLKVQLRPYQARAVAWMVSREV